MSILFLCDEKRCAGCTHKNGCYHTSDIKHAVNFKDDGCGAFVEQPALLEEKDSLTELVKELNNLLINYHDIKKLSRTVMFANLPELQKRYEKLEKSIELSISCISEKIEEEVRDEYCGLTVNCMVDSKLFEELQKEEADNGSER